MSFVSEFVQFCLLVFFVVAVVVSVGYFVLIPSIRCVHAFILGVVPCAWQILFGVLIGICLAQVISLVLYQIRLRWTEKNSILLEDGTISEAQWTLFKENHKRQFYERVDGQYKPADGDYINRINERYTVSLSKSVEYQKAKHTRETEGQIKKLQANIQAWETKYKRDMNVRFKPSTKQLHAYQEQVL